MDTRDDQNRKELPEEPPEELLEVIRRLDTSAAEMRAELAGEEAEDRALDHLVRGTLAAPGGPAHLESPAAGPGPATPDPTSRPDAPRRRLPSRQRRR